MSQIQTIILLFLCIVTKHQVTPIASLIGDVQTVANFANDALAFFKGELPLENLIMGSTGHALNQIIEKMDEISESLERMEANNERRMNHMINTLMNRLPLQNRVDTGMTELHSYMVRIDGLFEHFEFYVKQRESFNNYTIKSFIDAVTSHKKGDLVDILDNMYRLMMPGRSRGFKTGLPDLVYMNNQGLDFPDRCSGGSSIQQRLYEIYNAIVISESRAFAMIVFAYALLMAYEKQSFSAEMEKAASQLVLRSEEYIVATQRAMTNASRVVDRCDPNKFKRGQNFYELEGAMQMYVIHEPDVASGGSCTGTCGDIFAGWVDGCYDYERWCPKRTCYGYTHDCQSAASSTVCDLPSNERRRLDYVKDYYGTVYGDSSSCSGSLTYPQHWTRGTVSCDVCICTCSEQMSNSPAIRTINLRPKITDIKANMVLIGIKFVEKDRQITMVICEGQLQPGGRIMGGTEHWIPAETFEYVRGESYGGNFYLLEGDSRTKMSHNDDYAFIRYYQKKMYLDDIDAPFGYVVTGVRFKNEATDRATWNETPIQLEIYVTKFDFNTGNLSTDDSSSYWLRPQDQPDPSYYYSSARRQVVLDQPHDPTLAGRSTSVSDPNQYIEFRPTDRYKDAGQGTVPFFDGQPVMASPNIASTGVGLYHKGFRGSGGFLAFRLLTLNLPNYLNTKLTDDMIARYKPKYDGALPYPIE